MLIKEGSSRTSSSWSLRSDLRSSLQQQQRQTFPWSWEESHFLGLLLQASASKEGASSLLWQSNENDGMAGPAIFLGINFPGHVMLLLVTHCQNNNNKDDNNYNHHIHNHEEEEIMSPKPAELLWQLLLFLTFSAISCGLLCFLVPRNSTHPCTIHSGMRLLGCQREQTCQFHICE